MAGSSKMEDVECAWEMLKEARIMLHLVEDSLGLQDRVTEEPTALTGARELERQKESSPEMDGYLGPERSSLDIATNPETADWSFLSGEIFHKNQAQKSMESQGSQGPSLGQESWNPRNSALSLSSLTQDHRRQLLKSGSPRGHTLDRLQQRICQQKLKHRNGEGDEGPIHTPVVTQRGPLVRKVLKVTFAPRLPAYRGLSTGREKTHRLEKPLFSDKLSTLKYGPRRLTGGQETADKTVGPVPLKKNAITNPSCLRINNAKPASRAPGVSAWKEAQRLVMQILGPPRQHLETQRENSAPPWTRDAQFPSGKTQGGKFPGEQKRSPFDVISNGKLSAPPNSQTFGREDHTPSENLNSKTLLEKCPPPSGRTSSISKERPAPLKSVPRSSSTTSLHTRHGISNSSSSPQGSTFSAGPTSLSNDPLTPLKTLRSPDSVSPTSALCRKLSGGKENVGVRRPAVSGSRRAEEVLAFMGQQERARRRKAQQEKQEVLREKERRKNMMQEVLRKQQEALHKAQRSHRDRGVKERNRPTSSCKKEEPSSLGPGEKEQNVKKSREPQQKRRPAVKKLKIRGQPMEGGSPLKLVDLASSPRKAQARRVEALRQAAAALGSRVEMEAALLGAGSGLTGRPVAEPTGPLNNRSLALALGGTSAQPRDWDSTSISEDLPWSEETPEFIVAQPGFLQQTATVRGAESRGEKSTENAGPATLSIWKPSRTRKGSRRREEVIDKNQAGAHAGREKDQKTSGPLGNSAKTSQEWGQDGARSSQVTGNTSPESSSSEAHTDSTSKWSEVSQFFGCGDMLNRLSLELSQQSLRDAELRDRQHVALFRLREEALKEKTQAELAWLEHQKMSLKKGEEAALLDITRRQKEVVNRLQQEQAEIWHLRNVYKAARRQRKLLLQHQREILGIKRETAQVQQDLQACRAAVHPSKQVDSTASPALLPTGGNLNACSISQQNTNNKPTVLLRDPDQYDTASVLQGYYSSDTNLQKSHPGAAPPQKKVPKLHVGEGGTRHQTQGMPEEDALPSERGGQGPATEAQLCCAPQEGANGDDGTSKREINPHPLKSNTPGDTPMNPILEIGKKDTTEPGLECQRDHPDPQCPHRIGEVLGESLDEGVPEKQGQISASMPQGSPEELQDRCLTETERHLKGLLPLQEMWSWKRRRTVPEIRVRGMTLEGAEADFTSLHHECQTSELEHSVSEMQDRNRQNTDKSPESSTKCSPEQEFQRASAVRVNISDVTVSAPEIEKDLPLDLENSNWEIMQFGSPEYQNTVNTGSRLLSARYPVGCKESHTLINRAVQDSVWYKAQIGQQAKCLLTVNSNPETIPSSDDTGVKNNQSVSLQACTEVEKNEREYQLINQPAYTTESSLIEITAPVKEIATDNLSKDSLPLAADSGKADSRGFGDEPSENYGKLTYPLSCEGQKSSEKDQLPEKILGSMMSLAAEDQKSSKVLDDAKAKIHTTSQCNKTRILETCPEFCSANPEVHMLHKEKHITQKAEAFTALKVLAYEETLSEILSPVDEVLSYGSTELPSIAGAPKFGYTEASLTPPPSTDNITMTSEDDFPPPPAEIVQLQVGNNSTEDDRSIKSEDLPSLSEDLSVPVDVCDASEKKAIPCVGETAGSTERETMRVNSAKIKGHFLLDKDELSSSLNNNKILSEEQNNNEDHKSKLFVSVSAEDDSDESSDPLSSFEIGHRVLVCHTKPGVLKYKGPTSFAAGYWAGVALDSPNGHHNGTFRGVQYFECAKNCGVLVRAEDISHLLGEQDSDLDTKADDDPFSDDEPPKNFKSNQERSKCTTLSEKTSDGNTDRNQYHGRDGSTAPKMYSNSLYMVEMRKTHLQMSADLIEEESIYEASTCSVSKSSLIEINPLQQVIYEAARAVEEFAQSNSTLEHGPGLDNVDQTTKAVCDPSLFSAKTPTERCGNNGPRDDWIDTNLIQSDSHEIPMMGLSKLRERGLAVFLPQHTKNVESTNGRDLDLLVDRLAENLVNEAVRDALEIKKIQDTSENLKDNPPSKGPGSIVLGKTEENQKRINQLCFRDVWSCAISPEPVLESSVPPHSPEIVLSLVGAAVEQLWNHREGPGLKKYQVPDMGKVPPHLVNEESRRAYRQVIFDLTSDLFHSAFKSDQVPSNPFPGKGGSPFSAVLYAKTSLSDIKGFIQSEVQRQLNLGRSEHKMKRLLQTGSTYGKVQRDIVDCILIQELREEEPEWLDYSSDELSVKMKLTEQIFDLLLQDTIHILDHIYTGPLGVTSPEPFQPE